MAEASYPQRSISGDRKYTAEQLSAMQKATYSNGIVLYGSQLAVVESSGMNVSLSDGFAMIEGTTYINTAALSLAIDPADAVLNRIDRVIIRRSVANRNATSMVLKGTPGATPSAPALSRVSSGNWDIAVADVYVGAAVTEIVTANITPNILDAELCGIMTPRSELNTLAIENQVRALIVQLEYDLEQVAGGGVVAHAFTHSSGEADALDGYEKERLTFADQSVSTSGWATYAASGTEETKIYNKGYTYKKSLTLIGVLATMTAFIIPSEDKADCGASICNTVITYDGGINIYAKATPTAAFVLLSVDCFKAVG